MQPNTFTATSWDERLVAGADEQPRVAHAHTTNRYAGIINGESVCDYLLYYNGPGYTGRSTGLERIEGTVDGRTGSFVIHHDGRFDDHGIEGTWHVLVGSGTGELGGVSGSGTLRATFDSDAVPYTFDYHSA